MKLARSKQRGVALIIVLLIVAIVSVLATEMGGRLQLQVKRASNIKESNQAYWYAMGAEQYARKAIRTLMKEDGKVIYLEQPWNQEFAYPIVGGGIQAQLVDMQSCFNLNALKEPTNNAGGKGGLPDRMAAFYRLLQNVEGGVPSYNMNIVRDSLVDWLDDDDIPRPEGAEDSEYESRSFPYMAANNYMVDKSELRLINGVQVKWLQNLLKLVCVLPNESTFKINVNTVSEENAAVIAAAAGLSLSDAKSLISNRDPKGFQTVEEFLKMPEILSLSLSDEQKKWFDVKTSHFILYTKARYNDATFSMQTLFKVDEDGNVVVVRREFAGF